MAVSRRVAGGWAATGVGLLTALAMIPMGAGASPGPALAGGCSATAHIDSQWGSGPSGGEVLTVTVVNTSPASGSKWTVTWTLASGQQVLNAWNATVTTSHGVVTAVNAPYNGTLAPGASTTFGVQLGGAGPVIAPSCGNDAVSPSPAGSPTTTPINGAGVTVTEADSQSTVTLLVGQTLGVSLPSYFTPPTVSGTVLTQLSSSGGYPSGQPVSARYQAVAAGQVDISSQTDAECLHTTPPCAIPVALWVVHVKVVVPPSSGGGQTVEVTTADNQGSVSLHIGDTLVVNLVVSPPANYTPPTVKPSGVLSVTSVTGGYPTDQPLVARYLAVAPGQADVTSLTDSACNHQPTPCPSPQVPWTVHVTVS